MTTRLLHLVLCILWITWMRLLLSPCWSTSLSIRLGFLPSMAYPYLISKLHMKLLLWDIPHGPWHVPHGPCSLLLMYLSVFSVSHLINFTLYFRMKWSITNVETILVANFSIICHMIRILAVSGKLLVDVFVFLFLIPRLLLSKCFDLSLFFLISHWALDCVLCLKLIFSEASIAIKFYKFMLLFCFFSFSFCFVRSSWWL